MDVAHALEELDKPEDNCIVENLRERNVYVALHILRSF